MPRIAIIGAGSVEFTRNILTDLCSYPELAGTLITGIAHEELPVSDLDPLARREFLQGLMEAVAEEGLSVILSSHIVSELERVCDHLVILNGGQVQVFTFDEDGVRP